MTYKRQSLGKKNRFIVRGFMAIFLSIILLINIASSLSVYNFSYDSNGNLAGNTEYKFGYNDLNQLVNLTDLNGKLIAEYFYDSSGNRAGKILYDEGKIKSTTYYVSKDFVREVNSSGVFDYVYYYDSYSLAAKKDPSGNFYFYHNNHLGSPEVITNSSGGVIEEFRYLPFGGSLSGENERYSFTGKEKDDESSLIYFGARYYEPYTLMRFTQPDSIISDVYDPQVLNRYSYARNNPVKYVDPSGNIIDTIADIGFIIWDIGVLAKNKGYRDWINWAALGGDIAGAFIPFLTGVGAGLKIGAKSLRAAEKVSDAGKISKFDDFIGGSGKAADGVKKGKKGFEFEKEGLKILKEDKKLDIVETNKKFFIMNKKEAGEIDGLMRNGDIIELKQGWADLSPHTAEGKEFLGDTAKRQYNNFKYFQFQEGKGKNVYFYPDKKLNPDMKRELEKIGYIVVEDLAK